jgi:hypothetical protein
VAGLLAGYVLRDVVVHPWLPSALTRFAAWRWGVEVRIEVVSGDWFREIRVDGLSLSVPADRDGPVRRLEIDTLSVRHDLGTIRELVTEGARCGLDLRQRPEGGASEGGWELPSTLDVLSVERLDLDVLLGDGWSVRLVGGSLLAELTGGRLDFDVAIANVEVDGEWAWRGPVAARGSERGGRVHVQTLRAGPGPGRTRIEASDLVLVEPAGLPSAGRVELLVEDVRELLGVADDAPDRDGGIHLSGEFHGQGRLSVTGELRGPPDGWGGHVAGEWSRELDATRVRLSTSGLEVGPAWIPGVAALGPVDGDIDVRWGAELEVSSSGHAAGLALTGGAPCVALTWELALSERRLVIQELVGRTEEGSVFSLEGSAPLDPLGGALFPDGPLDLRVAVRDPSVAALSALSGWDAGESLAEAHLEMSLGGTWRRPIGAGRLEVAEVRLAAVGARGSLRIPFELEDGVSVAGATLSVPGYVEAQAAGKLALPLDPGPWMEAGPRLWENATVTGTCSLDVDDLGWLASHVDGLRRIGGAASTSARISGSVRSPTVRGQFLLEGGEVKLASRVPAMSSLNVDLRLSGRSLDIQECSGELGGAPFRVRGSASMAGDAPTFDVTLAGDDLLILREPGVLIRADSDLFVTGPFDRLRIEGNLRLKSSLITRDVEIFDSGSGAPSTEQRGFGLFAFVEPPMSSATFDVAITSLEPVIIRNKLARGELRPALTLRGTGDAPLIEGTVRIGDTRVALPASLLSFESGSITLSGTDPAVPEVELLGTSRKLGYDITIAVSGPYDSPEVLLTSSPPLPSEDILLLLVAGRPPGDALSRESAQQAGQTVAVYFAEDVVMGWLSGGGGGSGEGGFFDRLEVTTGREVSESGLPTAELSFRVTERVFSGGDRVLLTMERDEYEHYGLGLRLVFRLR